MRITPFVLAATLLFAPAVGANQVCDDAFGRPSLGIGIGATTFDGRFSSGLVPAHLDQQVLANAGHGVRVDAGVGLTRRWGLRIERSSYRHQVERRTYAPPHRTVVRTKDFLGDMDSGELLVGVTRQRSPNGGRACVYSSVLAGTYRYSYSGISSRAHGIGALIGVAGAAGRAKPYAELRLGVAGNGSRPPLNAYASISLGASAGLRYRW